MDTAASQRILAIPPVAGLDLSITHDVVMLWLAAALTFVVLSVGCRRRGMVAHGLLGNMVETLVDLLDREVITANMGRAGRRWASFLLTLFFFILFANLMGLLPFPGYVHSITSNLSVTAALALLVFVITIAVSLRHRGVRGFLASFVPPGLPVWLRFLIVPIEIVSWLAKPVSLAVRLFANMVAGHSLLFVFIGLEVTAIWFLKPLPLAGAVAMECFELFVMFIQAFVFTMLSAMYIREAAATEH